MKYAIYILLLIALGSLQACGDGEDLDMKCKTHQTAGAWRMEIMYGGSISG